MQAGSLGQEDTLEMEMATLSNIHAWKIPWTEEPVSSSLWGHKKNWILLVMKQQLDSAIKSTLSIALVAWMMPPACQWNHKLKLTQIFSYYLIILFVLESLLVLWRVESCFLFMFITRKKLLAERNCIFHLLKN